MAILSSNLFSTMPNSASLNALASGVYVPSLTGSIGFNASSSGIPSFNLNDMLSLVEGPMSSLSQQWMSYASSVEAFEGGGASAAAASTPGATATAGAPATAKANAASPGGS